MRGTAGINGSMMTCNRYFKRGGSTIAQSGSKITLLRSARFHWPHIYDWRKAGDGLGKYINKSLFFGWWELRLWRD